ncbi:MAG: hypothetical protein ABWZ43_11185, partial [Solirubrobacterales bacterium]
MSVGLGPESATGSFADAPGVTPPSSDQGCSGFLSDVIVELGFADEHAVREAVAHSRRLGKPPESLLLENGAIGHEQLARAIAERNGLPFVDLAQFPVDDGARRLVGAEMARRYRAAPLAFDADGALIVALADPLDSLAVSDIGVITRSEVRTAVATEAAIEALLATPPAATPAPAPAQSAPGPEPEPLAEEPVSVEEILEPEVKTEEEFVLEPQASVPQPVDEEQVAEAESSDELDFAWESKPTAERLDAVETDLDRILSDEPTDPEPVIELDALEPEPVVEPATPEPEPPIEIEALAAEPEPFLVPEPTIAPEPVLEPEPVAVEPEPVAVEPEPAAAPEPPSSALQSRIAEMVATALDDVAESE